MTYWNGFIFYPQVNESTATNFSHLVKSRPGEEAFWIDCSWFKGAFPDGAGNWSLPIEDSLWSGLPNGLKPVADICHDTSNGQQPIQFILWVEPERIYQYTWLFRNHFDWLIPVSNTELGDLLLDLGQTEARQFITQFLSDITSNWGVDILRLDYNIEPQPYWQYQDTRIPNAPYRSGITEINYVMGLYTLWDELLTKHPQITIDNCASGGRRHDLETISRSFSLWRTDWMGPADTFQTITMGLSHFQPLNSGYTGIHRNQLEFTQVQLFAVFYCTTYGSCTQI